MSRYFLELTYKGTHYSGFQVQHNAHTIQEAVEQALRVFFREKINLTGSSRTDAGVHAIQNFFHFDHAAPIPDTALYNLNAILPNDIAIRKLVQMSEGAHCRFDAIAREYYYYLYHEKDPFLEDRAWFSPSPLDFNALQKAAEMVRAYSDFTSFSKRKTQVKTFRCQLQHSYWEIEDKCLVYKVKANRFLRGMVRGLVGTMLQVGRAKMDLDDFRKVIERGDNTATDFTTPAHGLFLVAVSYPEGYFEKKGG